jgi:hypothetical protein
MRKSLGLGVFILMFLVLGSLPRMVVADPGPPRQIPRSATVEILLLKAPGLNVMGSKWEIAYEFRITNEISLWTEREKFKDKSTERVGDLIKQATVKNSLDESPAGQKLRLEILFTAATLERLRNQPTSRITLTNANMTEENVKRNEEQELKSQVFLFYSVVSVYDAKLKKTVTIPVNRVWDFVDFPEVRFEVKIEINGENSFSVNSSRPKHAE